MRSFFRVLTRSTQQTSPNGVTWLVRARIQSRADSRVLINVTSATTAITAANT
ncbi:hypothetical protein JJ691_97850 [Kutzneria sp. CA-103260]|nr:hypothetical protein JJ691_97850 [Kutzneria sp. CA-103260]